LEWRAGWRLTETGAEAVKRRREKRCEGGVKQPHPGNRYAAPLSVEGRGNQFGGGEMRRPPQALCLERNAGIKINSGENQVSGKKKILRGKKKREKT